MAPFVRRLDFGVTENLQLTELQLKRTDIQDRLARDNQEIAALRPGGVQVQLSDYAQQELGAAEGRLNQESSDLKHILDDIEATTGSLVTQKCAPE